MVQRGTCLVPHASPEGGALTLCIQAGGGENLPGKGPDLVSDRTELLTEKNWGSNSEFYHLKPV